MKNIIYALTYEKDNTTSTTEDLRLKIWSPDYELGFGLENISNLSKSQLKTRLTEKMTCVLERQSFYNQKIIRLPQNKSELIHKYGGNWIKIPVKIESKNNFFEYLLPALSHILNLISLICATIMSYFGLLLTTDGIQGAQYFSVGIAMLSSIVALMIYSFSNVTQDMGQIGAMIDDYIHHQWYRLRNMNNPSLNTDKMTEFNQFYIEKRITINENQGYCYYIVLIITAFLMTCLITGNLTAAGISLFQQFKTMGAAVQKDGNAWLTDNIIIGLGITAVSTAAASSIPFQSGFAWRGTKLITASFLKLFGCSKPKPITTNIHEDDKLTWGLFENNKEQNQITYEH